MIPKIIHYCWFGQGKISNLESQCIESWRMVLPDYTIKCWTEKEFDFDRFEFAKSAYRLKKFAFVSDVCRLHALYQDGGIYLDTDMMVIKDFDELLKNDFFLGEEKEGLLSAGIIGAKKNNLQIFRLLEIYNSKVFNYESPIQIPVFLTSHLDRKKIRVYPKEYFYPLPYAQRGMDFKPFIHEQTMAVHLWNHSWKDEWGYLHDKDFRLALKNYRLRISREPLSFFKDRFLFDFAKNFIADRFSGLYLWYKKF